MTQWKEDIQCGGKNDTTLGSDLSLNPGCVTSKLGSRLGQLSYL